MPTDDSQSWRPNLSWLTDRLAIGGSFPAERAGHLASVHGIAALIDMRAEACDDAAALAGNELRFLHLPTPDLQAVSRAMLDRGVAFAGRHLRRGERVLIHCEHGIGRSSLLALCVLVDSGYEPLAALALAKAQRPLVSPSPAQYEAWADWLAARGHEAPSFGAFADIAYRHLARA